MGEAGVLDFLSCDLCSDCTDFGLAGDFELVECTLPRGDCERDLEDFGDSELLETTDFGVALLDLREPDFSL